ncbi:MAG: hypothetical protein H7256_05470 [Bdellovibrio sp.]|nr:hypothetical protein [Bdellovibrio sp.]
MKRSTLYKLAFTGLSLVSVTVFQNCGKLDIKNVDPSSLATSGVTDIGAGSGLGTDQPISLNPPVEAIPAATNPDASSGNNVTPNTSGGGAVAIIKVPADISGPADHQPTPAQPIKVGPGMETQPGAPMPVTSTPNSSPSVTPAQPGSIEAAALALCDDKVRLNTMSIVDISNFAGSLQFNADQVKHVTNILGGVLLRAVHKDSSVMQISNISANDSAGEKAVVLCNFNDVKQISNISGHIVLVNTHVTMLADHKGKLTLVNSQVDKIRNHVGELISLVALQ